MNTVRCGLWLLLGLTRLPAHASELPSAEDALPRGFVTPPDSAKRTWRHGILGNISKDEITNGVTLTYCDAYLLVPNFSCVRLP